MQITKVTRRFLREDSGATAIEYGLIVSGLVMLIVLALKAVSTNLQVTFTDVADELAAN